jgi:hypothetical protein
MFIVRKVTDVLQDGLLHSEFVCEYKHSVDPEDITADKYKGYLLANEEEACDRMIFQSPALFHTHLHDANATTPTGNDGHLTKQLMKLNQHCPRNEQSRHVMINGVSTRDEGLQANYAVLRFPEGIRLTNKFNSPDSQEFEGIVKPKVVLYEVEPFEFNAGALKKDRLKVLLYWKVAIYEDPYRVAEKVLGTQTDGSEALLEAFAGMNTI